MRLLDRLAGRGPPGSAPYPVLAMSGEHGSAKTSACRFARQVIDPSQADLSSPPKEARDLMIAALNSHVIGFDNLSFIPDWLSDNLCCLSRVPGSVRAPFTRIRRRSFLMRRDLWSLTRLLMSSVVATDWTERSPSPWNRLAIAAADRCGRQCEVSRGATGHPRRAGGCHGAGVESSGHAGEQTPHGGLCDDGRECRARVGLGTQGVSRRVHGAPGCGRRYSLGQ